MSSKSFYKDSNTTTHILFVLCNLIMIGLSIYLTTHYFDVKYPDGLGKASICDLNSFFNCDVATHSPASNIMGVPISVFGILISIFILFGYLFNDERTEGLNHLILIINAVGCLLLFIYSLAFLGGLCPFCTLYYIFSWAALFLYRKNSENIGIAPIPLAIYGVITLGISFAVYSHSANKEKNYSAIASSVIGQYEKLKDLGHPTIESDYRIVSATKKFTDAPVQITKYSDFECPSCKALSQVLHRIAKAYPGKINIQYFFYPLDRSCNPKMTRDMHRNACKASYLAACLPDKFSEIEEKIFEDQRAINSEFLDNLAKEYGVTECMNSEATKNKVVEYIKTGDAFNIQSTPTFFVNGKKIEGALPVVQLKAIIDSLLK